MGTIKCGFWTSRFLITIDEFQTWVDTCVNLGFSFYEANLPTNIVAQYRKFYTTRMNVSEEEKYIPLVCYSIQKEDFQSAFHIVSKEWSFYPQGGGVVRSTMFLELSTPKAYAVNCDDGIHFTYEDILQKEPNVKEVFDKLSTLIKTITKPLYYRDRPIYSIRISKQAYSDLLQSAFIKNSGEGLMCK